MLCRVPASWLQSSGHFREKNAIHMSE
jgi:hypothetical protein